MASEWQQESSARIEWCSNNSYKQMDCNTVRLILADSVASMKSLQSFWWQRNLMVYSLKQFWKTIIFGIFKNNHFWYHFIKVPVCPHAGGVGLCEYVQHLSMFDYVSVSGSMENRMTEYVHHLTEHFTYPAAAKSGRYLPPLHPGYGPQIKEESMDGYEFPNGTYWASRKS